MFAAVAALAPLGVYLVTMPPSIGLIDSGELTAVAWTLGVAHPTGYPLWTLLAHIFVHVVPLGEPAWRLNLLSALFTSGGSLLTYASLRELGRSRVASLVSALAFGFTGAVWAEATSVEVYPLTALLLPLALLTFARFRTGKGSLMVFAYACGLALTNHMMASGLLLPLLAVAVYRERDRAVRALPFLLAPLTIYLYLLARAQCAPALNWGDPSNLERLLWHVGAKQYRVWMFSGGVGGFADNLVASVSLMFGNWNVLLPLAALGIGLIKGVERFVVVAAAGLLLVYVSGYSIPDISAYFIPLFLVMTLPLSRVLDAVPRRARALAFVAPALLLVLGFGAHNWRGDGFVAEYSKNYLASVALGGTLISNYWDVVSPLIYRQTVLGERPDVTIVDKELLRRSWYLRQLERQRPRLFASSERELAAFRVELDKFEHDRPYDPARIQETFVRLIRSVATSNHPVHLALASWGTDERSAFAGLPLEPVGVTALVGGSRPRFDYGVIKFREAKRFTRTERERFVVSLERRSLAVAAERAPTQEERETARRALADSQ